MLKKPSRPNICCPSKTLRNYKKLMDVDFETMYSLQDFLDKVPPNIKNEDVKLLVLHDEDNYEETRIELCYNVKVPNPNYNKELEKYKKKIKKYNEDMEIYKEQLRKEKEIKLKLKEYENSLRKMI